MLAELFIVSLTVSREHILLTSAYVGLRLLYDSQWNVLLLFGVLLWQTVVRSFLALPLLRGYLAFVLIQVLHGQLFCF